MFPVEVILNYENIVINKKKKRFTSKSLCDSIWRIDDSLPYDEPHFFHFDLPEVGTERDERLSRKLKLLGLYIQGIVLRQTGGLSEAAADTPGLESDMRDDY